jgi:dTDP-4-amino-4,6-dideoxygalactose transaminase
VTEIMVPFVNLALQHRALKEKLLEAAGKVLDHGNFILGPEVSSFEERFAAYCGTRFAVGVNNGTSALFLVLRSLGIGSGDEVITATNSFLASASAIALAGARPVLVDVRDDYNIDPEVLEAAITPRTKAVIPVHLTGRPADMTAIVDIAQRRGLHLVEDCAQAIGAAYRRQRVGSFGIAGCFSLHPLKTLNAVGDGGVITTNDSNLYAILRKARNHGLRNRDECEFWSYNCRLDTLQAAMLLVKMDYIDRWNELRRTNADFYRQHLRDVVATPQDKPHEFSVYHTFIVRADRRDELQRYLFECGVDTKVHYPVPIHLQDAARSLGYGCGSFPVAERQARMILSLPVYPELTDTQREHMVTVIRRFYNATRC